jgi:hypothetical protein
MFSIELTGDEADKAKAKAVERRAKADGRSAAAKEAYKAAFVAADFDKDRLVVHIMPEDFGGAVILRVPGAERWAMHQKRLLAATSSEGKKADPVAVIAGIVEDQGLLVHPALADLQQWRDVYPGLYTTIHEAISTRCGGEAAGKG